jgi:hypothetical protein
MVCVCIHSESYVVTVSVDGAESFNAIPSTITPVKG